MVPLPRYPGLFRPEYSGLSPAEQEQDILLEWAQFELLSDDRGQSVNTSAHVCTAGLSRYQDKQDYAQAFFILIFCKEAEVAGLNA